MKIEVINTGTEILLGSVMNTHLTFFAQELFKVGLRIERQATVPDGMVIGEVLKESMTRADIVLVTGGLGPTSDDLTRELIAEMLGLPLEFNEEVMATITGRFARRNLTMTDRVPRQAQVPRGASVLANQHGTAPGLYLPAKVGAIESPHIFLLPGPPRELQPMFTEIVLPLIREIVPGNVDLVSRIYRVIGIGESNVEAKIGAELLAMPGLELGYCARPGEVDVRCIGTAAVVDAAEKIVFAAFSDHIASLDNRALEEVILDWLNEHGKKLAVAESCTGGAIANAFTNVPGASNSFLAGLVTYANEAKTEFLGVPAEMISEHGAVSAPVAQAMAQGARNRAQADFAISTTGIAGPGGGTLEKPVGTVFIGLATPTGASSFTRTFPGSRERFKFLTTQAALDLLRRSILELPVS